MQISAIMKLQVVLGVGGSKDGLEMEKALISLNNGYRGERMRNECEGFFLIVSR
jgi:hypothetical protein